MAFVGCRPRRRTWNGHVALWLVLAACSDPPSTPNVGSNTNWLKACETNEQCGRSTACHCGACTAECGTDADCSALSNARCALGSTDPAAWAECETSQPTVGGICLPRCQPGGCGEGQACVAGACVLVPVPTGDFCAPVASPAPADRTGEDELLDAIQATRIAGGVTCGTNGPTSPVPALRLDTRLLCSARVLASDLAATHADSLVDSQGRTTDQRLALVGYTPRAWAEGYAVKPSAAEAMNLMLGGTQMCAALTDARYQDVGMGNSGGVFVVTLAMP